MLAIFHIFPSEYIRVTVTTHMQPVVGGRWRWVYHKRMQTFAVSASVLGTSILPLQQDAS